MNKSSVVADDRSGRSLTEQLPDEEAREFYRQTTSVSDNLGINRLKSHRTRAGLSLAVVARVTGQHVTTVARHETRTKKIPVFVLEMYSQIYGVDIKKLMLQDTSI
jgi:DNA-binding transcriptional regulator YiaG